MGLDIGEIFKEVVNTGLEILKESAVKQTAKVPAVQKEIAKQAEQKGKDILWTVAPLLIGGVVLLLILRR